MAETNAHHVSTPHEYPPHSRDHKEPDTQNSSCHKKDGQSGNDQNSPHNKDDRKRALVDGPLLPTLLKFMLPISLTVFLQMGYGTADLLILGQFGSIADLSGATIGGRLLQLIMTFFIGLALGATILIGQYIGKQKTADIGKIVGTSIVVFTFIALAVTGILIFFADDIITVLKTPPQAMDEAHDYLIVCSLGILFIVYYNLFGCIYRGFGDSKTPMITVFFGCMLNIVLDLIFIVGFDMGAMGAALGTVIAQGACITGALLYIKKKGFPYTVSRKDFIVDKQIAIDLLKLGTPAALQSILVNISFLAVTRIINEFGVVASASVGIVERISGVIVVVPIGFMQALAAFTAQNNGAGQFKRAKTGLRYALMFSAVFGAITGYLGYFHGTIFTSLFTSDPETTMDALAYLKSYSVDSLLVAIMFTMNGYFNGCGKTAFVMYQSVFGAVCFRIPLAHILSEVENTSLFIIGLATPASSLVQLTICFIYYYYYQKQIAKERSLLTV